MSGFGYTQGLHNGLRCMFALYRRSGNFNLNKRITPRKCTFDIFNNAA